MASEADPIVAKVLGGDADAFEEIVRLYEADVRRIASSLLQGREAVVDLVQEVFVNAYFSLDRYRQGEDFGVWVRAIARNLVRKELRQRSRETRRLQVYRDHLVERYQEDGAAERYHASIAEAHRSCREQLPSHGEEVLRLHYAQNLSLQDVAARLDRSLEAVKQLLYRTRLMLRDCIARKMVQA